MNDTLDPAEDLSPARKDAFQKLEAVEPATYREVAEAANLKPETARDALHWLRGHDLVERVQDPTDARRSLWSRADSE